MFAHILLFADFVRLSFAGSPVSYKLPPLGWSSWYALGQSVNQTAMEETYRKLATYRRAVVGSPTNKSLLEVGYRFANLDDGWQACGQGVNGSFHDAQGYPLMDLQKFPNVTALTALAHSLGLSPGFYVNNYICGRGECAGGVSSSQYARVMRSTVAWLKAQRFEYLKVDSGGCYNDMQLWHELLLNASHPMIVENCHQGGIQPNETWCPFDLWRVGGDVNGLGPDNEILKVIQAIKVTFPRAGCRPYPDFMSFDSNVGETRSLFGLYAIMGTPMVMSFDIRDDTRLLPVWDILTNVEIINVNQDSTAAVGTLLNKFSAHPLDASMYAWTGTCSASDANQTGWAYDVASKAIKFRSDLCLDASGIGDSMMLVPCGKPSKAGSQSWILQGGRLWQADQEGANPEFTSSLGSLTLAICAPPIQNPGQHWQYTLGGPSGYATTNVQVNLTARLGGCWEITGCSFSENADVGTTYGCKSIPTPGDESACDYNGAWSFNSGNQTITSVMSGKCLAVDEGSNRVGVSSCTGGPSQRWHWQGISGTAEGAVESVAKPGKCIDNGAVPAPRGTTGNCAALSNEDGNRGPGVVLANAGSNGSPCISSKEPSVAETVTLDGNRLKVGDLCVSALHGAPSPFGPLQLWAKPLAGGACAVLLANRGTSGPTVQVKVALSDLPGLDVKSGVVVRDLWLHEDLPISVVRDGVVTLNAPPRGSSFFVVRSATMPAALVV